MANRKNEGYVGRNLKIMIVDKEIAKNTKLYQFPPKILNSVPPPPDLPDSWFTFSTSKEYYPVGIFNGDKLITTDPKKAIPITFSIFSNDTNVASYETKAKPLRSGVYWFSVIKAHSAEQLSLRFSGDGVEPLSFEIDVIHSEKSKSTKCVATQLVSKIYPKLVSARFLVEEEELSEAALVAEELPENNEQAPVELIPQWKDNVKGDNFIESTLPMPQENSLNEKTQQEQLLVDHGCVVAGPLYKVFLPAALIKVLLEDKKSQSQENFALIGTNEGFSTSSVKRKLVRVPLNLSPPSVGDLFHRLHERALSVIIGEVKQVNGCVDTLRQLFERYCEDHLLYPDERVAVRQRSNLLLSQRSTFADKFGAHLFLRFVALVVSSAQIVSGVTSDKVNSSSSSISGQSESDSGFFTVTRARGAARQSKNGHSKMQQILELAILILSEQAHALFH